MLITNITKYWRLQEAFRWKVTFKNEMNPHIKMSFQWRHESTVSVIILTSGNKITDTYSELKVIPQTEAEMTEILPLIPAAVCSLFPVEIRRLQRRFITVSPHPNPREPTSTPTAPAAAGRRGGASTGQRPQQPRGSQTVRRNAKTMKESRDINRNPGDLRLRQSAHIKHRHFLSVHSE